METGVQPDGLARLPGALGQRGVLAGFAATVAGTARERRWAVAQLEPELTP